MKPTSVEVKAEEEMMKQSMRKAKNEKDPLEKLRLLCLARGSGGILDLGRIFRRMDKDGSAALSFKEFTEGIHKIGLKLPDDQVKTLFHTFDKDGSGSICVDEFIRALRPEMSDTRKKSVNDAFDKLDASKKGVITLEDLRRLHSVRDHTLYDRGEQSEAEILTKFMANFENGCIDGKITREEFMNYYAGMSAAIDTDTYFDLMIRQAYKL